MHVQFFPVYVLTCGARNSKPSLSFDVGTDFYQSHISLLTRCDFHYEFQAAGVSRQPDL